MTADGLYLSLWSEPIRFVDIKEMNTMDNWSYNLILTFNEKRKNPYNSWFSRETTKCTIPISNLNGKPTEIVQTIYKYYLRQ